MQHAITLSNPVTVDGREITALQMRKPKVRDRLIAMQSGGSDMARIIRLLANLCDVPDAVIEELSLRDFYVLEVTFQDFFAPGFEELIRGIAYLSRVTSWTLTEIKDLDLDELAFWLKHI